MLTAIELAAVITSAIYGILLALRKGFDFVGIFTVAFLVAFGGGTLRDLFLDRSPLFWIANSHYALIVFGMAFLGALTPKVFVRSKRFLHLPDAFGLALFTITGAAYAIQAETSMFIASLMGVVTGTFGGVLGDVTCNEIPSLFRSAPLYATCAFTGAWIFVLGEHFALPVEWVAPAAAAVIILFRLAALHWDLRLPERSSPDS